jgi:hypothetical protein
MGSSVPGHSRIGYILRRFLTVWPVGRNEQGYVLPWVLIFALVAGLVIVPFLNYMQAGVRASYSQAFTMQEFYAADSGLEDALHKIKSDYSAATQLAADVDAGDTTLSVDSTVIFPPRGVIQIGTELVSYSDKTDTEFTGCVRGYGSSHAASHDSGALVTVSLPSAVGDTWEYGIEDINGSEVGISIQNRWVLSGLETDANGTEPNAALVVIGHMLDMTTTQLSSDIDDDDTTIPVASTALFLPASADSPRVIRIEEELIQYTGVTATEFTGCTRGFGDTLAAGHAVGCTVTSNEVAYQTDMAYDDSQGNIKIDRVGAWLPPGFDYVPGSSNVATELDNPIFSSATSIPVVSTILFPDSGVLAIENELIYYGSKDVDVFEDCIRGYNGTAAADHLTAGIPVSAEPNKAAYHGGIALTWDIPTPCPSFEELPRPAPLGGGSQPTDEFPVKRMVTFRFSPAAEPNGIFSWIRTTRHDIYLSWDKASRAYEIISVATNQTTGTRTAVKGYVNTSKLTGRITQVFGDARAIGNSLIRGDPVNRDELHTQSSAFIDSSHGNAIPDGAEVEAAYLYWSGWRSDPWDVTGYTTADLGPMVNQAVFNGVAITADRVQALPNKTSGGGNHGWSFSCFKDVTSMLEPEQSADITLSPGTSPDSVTIINTGGYDLDLSITVLSGPSGGYVTVDGQAISVGNDEDFGIQGEAQIASGDVAGDYVVRLEVTSSDDEGTVDGMLIDGDSLTPEPDSIDISLSTIQTPPEATITKITTTATLDIANNTPDTPPDPQNNITIDGTTVSPGDVLEDIWYNSANPSDTISGAADDRSYEVNIACSDGKVKVEYGSTSVILGGPGSQTTNGEYTLGLLDGNRFVTEDDLGDEWSHAGWSLIVIYSHPDDDARQLFLYDDFTYVSSYANNFPAGYVEFDIGGFLAPADFDGVLTCFIGEGDPHYAANWQAPDGDYIELNGYKLPRTGSPYDDPYDDPDGLNPLTNVWNGISSVPGIEGSGSGEGIDVDAFWIEEPVIDEGDSSATLKLDSGVDIWNIVYIFLAFRTDPMSLNTGSDIAIINFSS